MSMLKATVLMLGFLPIVVHQQPAGPAMDPNPDYPLHVRVLGASRTQDQFGVHGFGRADLLGPPVQGMDYTYDCSRGFIHNVPAGEFYQARWKKPNRQMEFLIQEIGGKKPEKCDVNVTLKDVPYGRYPKSAGQAAAPAATPAP